jgi:hypothetical protein
MTTALVDWYPALRARTHSASERGAKRRRYTLDLTRRQSHCSLGKNLNERQRAMIIKMVLGVRRWTRRATSCLLKGERIPGAVELLDVSVMAKQ